MNKTSKLDLFNLIEETVDILENNNSLYEKAVLEITSILSGLFVEFEELMDVHTRIKSASSLKEKIIRNKLYKLHKKPQELLDNLSDLIGIMLECRFNKNEDEFYQVIKEHFSEVDESGMYYNSKTPQMLFDLKTKQPQKQKNGHGIYRIDGYYVIEGEKVNFELQIKSLVNKFWSDIEHKVIYKNNVYIDNSGYIMEMLSAIKGNLVGIDKMLQLVNDQIKEKSVEKRKGHIDFERAIAKLISDTFIAKMSESIGFTVGFKKICDLISSYIVNKYKDLPVTGAQAAFLDLANRFDEIYSRDINWEEELYLEGEFVGEDRFCQIFGDRLISYMNTDFEWHLFFLILFQIESDNNNLISFNQFMRTLKNSYSDKLLYKELYKTYDEESAEMIYNDITEFLAFALSATASISIIDSKNEKIIRLIDDIISYIIYNFSSYDDFIKNRRNVQLFILDKWGE
ncbi:ppGpp synthetase/RelA/SpoT-type nucleotidyltransferase [Natranaerovirga hydrolytica]|uniref:PpGpp synthetase/RelA/SpoT-type nucleotidyltransferase n=2 Tax=Natranaerovirga hydrolytica TaxID=680378 RepID=A0A4R1N869_9FIRM|nr:ppGpp synthetase/RelA/SpoT-type nucleotidyltransferase [Natranaerovirga hydrolytica]